LISTPPLKGQRQRVPLEASTLILAGRFPSNAKEHTAVFTTSSWASRLVTEQGITTAGCPVAQPKFSSQILIHRDVVEPNVIIQAMLTCVSSGSTSLLELMDQLDGRYSQTCMIRWPPDSRFHLQTVIRRSIHYCHDQIPHADWAGSLASGHDSPGLNPAWNQSSISVVFQKRAPSLRAHLGR